MSQSDKVNVKSESDIIDSKPASQQLPFDYLQSIVAEDDVSLSQIFEILWRGKSKILLATGVFFLLGVFHYSFAPKDYKSNTVLLQESQGQQGTSQGLQLLGQLGGFNFSSGGAGSREISPELYPEIIESVDFQRVLLFEPIAFSTYGEDLTLFEYFNNYYKVPVRDRVYKGLIDYTVKLPFTLYRLVRNLFSGNQPAELTDENVILDRDVLILSPQFRYAMSEIKNRINLDYDGLVLDVETKLEDPMAASQINTIIAERIREYIINYRSEKARQNLQFVENLHRESKERYETAQYNLAEFSDRNQGNLTARTEIERERLQDERNLTFQIYSSISERLEESKVRLQEDTPVFTTIQQPILPVVPEEPTILVIPACIILGIIVGIVWIFGGKAYLIIRNKISEFES